HMLDERLPADELHREEPFVGVGHELVELHEIRMRDVGERAELSFESIQRVGREVAQRLQRDDGIPASIVRLVDDAETAFAEAALNHETVRSAEFHIEGMTVV